MKKVLRKRRIILIASIGLLFVVAVIGSYLLITAQNNRKSAGDKPSFSFDTTKAPNWWSGGNSWPDPKDFTEAQNDTTLPIASITAFQGTRETPGPCFIMAFYQKGAIDIDKNLREREAGMLSDNDPTVLKHGGGQPQEFQTPEGLKTYVLYQYNLDVPNVQKGNEFGFIQLKEGYVEVRGICESFAQLEGTLLGLAALKLNP